MTPPEHSDGEELGDTSQSTELDVLDENAIPAISLDELDITKFRENIADGKWFIKFYAPVGCSPPPYHPPPAVSRPPVSHTCTNPPTNHTVSNTPLPISC